jgi:hypothetical protein
MIYSGISMLASHPYVLRHHKRTKILDPNSMKTSGLDMRIMAGCTTHKGMEHSGSREFSGPSSISVSKILDCTQQPFMVVAEELYRSVFHIAGPWSNFSIQSGTLKGKSNSRYVLMRSENPDHNPL